MYYLYNNKLALLDFNAYCNILFQKIRSHFTTWTVSFIKTNSGSAYLGLQGVPPPFLC